MANLYWVYNIKLRRFDSGPHPSSAVATATLRDGVVKSGTRCNDQIDGSKSSDFEVITVTAP